MDFYRDVDVSLTVPSQPASGIFPQSQFFLQNISVIENLSFFI